jgi:PBP1b-binding outer membrane lipoprotein LpoB
MKKRLIAIVFITLFVYSSCSEGTHDAKNKVKQYPTTDTTDQPERKNDPFADSTNKSYPTEKSID